MRRPTIPQVPPQQVVQQQVQQQQQQQQNQQNQQQQIQQPHQHPQQNLAREQEAVLGPYFPDIPRILPHERVFPIQIGSELFRLSGASISSDAPSYFSQFFEQQLAENADANGGGGGAGGQIRTLYIDRDPATFRDIARHLQGYHVSPEDASHYVKLFADAQFYSLPKLISQLYESDFFISIGNVPFRIPRDLFSNPGDSSNFFGLNVSVNFTSNREIFPGLHREGLLRPPSILPPNVPKHSPETFRELLHYLRGYPVNIRDEVHRQELLQDARYYNLRGLEQKLIPCVVSWNGVRGREEIVVRLEDIKPSRISWRKETGFVVYGRPWVDEIERELVVEVGGEEARLLQASHTLRVEFKGQSRRRITNLFQRIADRLNLATTKPLGLVMMQQQQAAQQGGGSGGSLSGGSPPSTSAFSPGSTPLSEDLVKVRIDSDCHVVLDGREVRAGMLWGFGLAGGGGAGGPPPSSSAPPNPGFAQQTQPGFQGAVGGMGGVGVPPLASWSWATTKT
ncbi:hypothetical protein DFH27DRAFT_512591 [Peziza echinospora]|nr:hypothetical protein DFH27DRAFT_512591 [Peziza echinospora]